MSQPKFLFVGNRAFILEELFRQKCDVPHIFAVENSYLERTLQNKKIPYETLKSKAEFIQRLKTLDFDVLISNGCKFILPVSELKIGPNGKERRFVNIHPSYLPDLRGKDPQPGALLHGKTSGATCHTMDDGVDTGNIISQVKIPFTEDLDAALLYQLTFKAEVQVFNEAIAANFNPQKKQTLTGNEIEYSFSESDLKISTESTALETIHKVKAFSNKNKGAFFQLSSGEIFKTFDAELISNPFIQKEFALAATGTIVLAYESYAIVRFTDGLVKFKAIQGDFEKLKTGSKLA